MGFVKYETLVTHFAEWLHDYLRAFDRLDQPGRRLFGLARRRKRLKGIYERFSSRFQDDFSVATEDKFHHKRQVAPGDHRRKLSSSTISDLNRDFAHVLTDLEYDF